MKVRQAVAKTGLYAPPLEGRAGGDLLLLDFNESTVPPPPQVVAAINGFLEAGRARVYPEYQPFLARLAAYAGVPEQQLILTNGSDQALDIIVRALVSEGDEVVFPRPGFAMIPQIAGVHGAKVVSPQYRPDMSFPVDEVLEAVTPRTRLIALTSPNNPTGTLVAPGELQAILERVADVPVLVDEAYFEYTGLTHVVFLARHDNLVITRTFSKAFALAGLRVGYAISNPAFIGELAKVRGPYDVNMLAVTAAATLLEQQTEWRGYIEEVMTRAKPMVERFFDEHGVPYFKGSANFMLVEPGDATDAYEFLKRNRILVRPQREPIAGTFRLSVGTVADMTRFMGVYSDYLGAPRATAQDE